MRADELQKMLNQRPFEPLRLHISGGETADIRHPELAIVGRSLVFVARGRNNQADAEAKPGQIVNHAAHYNLLHVVKIEPINGRTPPIAVRTRDGLVSPV
jgi:hypothetical protein